MSRTKPELRLERILMTLAVEVAEATDEEVLAAAADLGIKPLMKGSIASPGLMRFLPYDADKLAEPDAEWGPGGPENKRPPTKRGRVD